MGIYNISADPIKSLEPKQGAAVGNNQGDSCNCNWGLIGVLSNCQGPIKDTKRTRGRPDRNVAPCSRPITTVIAPLHECKKVCPCTKALPPSGSRA